MQFIEFNQPNYMILLGVSYNTINLQYMSYSSFGFYKNEREQKPIYIDNMDSIENKFENLIVRFEDILMESK
jgi:hypothetical protein